MSQGIGKNMEKAAILAELKEFLPTAPLFKQAWADYLRVSLAEVHDALDVATAWPETTGLQGKVKFIKDLAKVFSIDL